MTEHQMISMPTDNLCTGVTVDGQPIYAYLAAGHITLEFRNDPAELIRAFRQLADDIEHEMGNH